MVRISIAAMGLVLLVACSGERITAPADVIVFGDTVLYAEPNLPLAPSCAAQPADLVSWWRAESSDTTMDMIGSNHGQTRGTVSYASAQVGEGFVFDGTNAVVIPHDPSLDFDKELTVEMWYSRVDVGGWWGLIGKRDDGSSRANFGVNASREYLGLGLYYNDPSPTVQGGDDPSESGFETSRLGWLPPAAEFHHFAGTYRQLDSASIELRIYVDGRPVHGDTLPGNLQSTLTQTDLTIGASYDQPILGERFRGVIDEVSLYRRALEPEEIAAIAEADGAGKCLEAAAPPAIPIELRLGNGRTTLNCGNPNRVIALKLLSTDTFDATTIDHTTVRLQGGGEWHVSGPSREPTRHEEDVDGDGKLDLVVHVRLGDTDIQCGDTEVELTGQTFGGTEITATAAIRTVGG